MMFAADFVQFSRIKVEKATRLQHTRQHYNHIDHGGVASDQSNGLTSVDDAEWWWV